MLKHPPQAIYRGDYTAPDFLIDQVDLRFELNEEHTQVNSKLQLRHNPDRPASDELILVGQELELLALKLDRVELSPKRYQLDAETLRIGQVPAEFTLEIATRIQPRENTSLEGLYQSGGLFCTQCEAEGFRKITYFLDRPDVMATYTTTIIADRDRYPVLLSNGNLVDSGELADARHWIRWHDPFKKPSYLFALVAGDLRYIEDHYTTRSGRRVSLRIYVEPHNIDQCEHAMRSLKKAMAWEEQVFDLEYDLDIYMIVAVGDFNMGAMENKGLNVFNTKYVLAKPETATDQDYLGIESVIAHEYFHNWTGNRVTCRDWFQLSLKEGLTVFRDQEFSADIGSRGVKRIEDVRVLRSVQFPEDAGPMAHPVRPDSYIEINNFYTATVYEKGAEVVRMLHTLLGRDGFRRGMDLYFQRHDGQAVTCDDFVSAMETANAIDLTQFRRWYAQAGTPELTVTSAYDPANASYTLTVRQSAPTTPGQTPPLHIPLALGLLDTDGHDLPLQLEGENTLPGHGTRVLELRQAEQQFRFVNLPQRPVPSLLRGFSAPLKLRYDYSDEDLLFLLAQDSDDFNRWEAGQQLLVRTVLQLIEERRAGRSWHFPSALATAFRQVLTDQQADPSLRALVLTLPSEIYLAEQMQVIDVDGIHEARNFLRRELAAALHDDLLESYQHSNDSDGYQIDATVMGQRSLKNRCLDYLMLLPEPALFELGWSQFRNASNMTDQLAALRNLVDLDRPESQQALDEFYRCWSHEALVVDKWLALQAGSQRPDTLAQVQVLLNHSAFSLKNPNKVRSLIGAFSHNPIRFHAIDGSGYRFVADQVLALDRLNPQVAARLLNVFTRWRRYDQERQNLLRQQLQRILTSERLSSDVYEIAAKGLGG